MEKFSSFSFAVAWATHNPDLYKSIGNEKLSQGVIGTHFFQTTPKVLEDYIDDDRVRFALDSGPIFHPKTYLFKSDNHWVAFIGSANLTWSAFNRNTEITTRIEGGKKYQSVSDDLERRISQWHANALVSTAERAKRYRDVWKVRRSSLKRLLGKYGKAHSAALLESRIMSQNWEDFVSEVKKRSKEERHGRLSLLKTAREAFELNAEFLDIPEDIRRAVAGQKSATEPNWAWFGNMQGARKLWPAMKHHVSEISLALSHIPLEGDVTKSQFLRYLDNFKLAFPDGGYGLATVTRFLALKRPDQFVCIDTANKKRMSSDLRIPASHITWPNYWDLIVERLRDSPWWNAPDPQNEDSEIWKGRAALLDCFLYQR